MKSLPAAKNDPSGFMGWLMCLTLLGILNMIFIVKSGLKAPYFVDESNFIKCAQHFLSQGIYSLPEYPPFNPTSTTAGLPTTFPGGVAAVFGFDMVGIRIVSFLFSFFMIGIPTFMVVNAKSQSHFSFKSFWGEFLWSLFFLTFFFSYLPYIEGSYQSLGEVPSAGYLAIGLVMLSDKKNFSRVWGFGFVGVSIWGGKFINAAFGFPLLFFYLTFCSPSKKEAIKAGLGFFGFQILWTLFIFLRLGWQGGLDWLSSYFGMFVQLGSFSLGSFGHTSDPLTQPTSHSLFVRLHDPHLEWAGNPLILKIKIVLFLFFPALLFICKFVKSSGMKPVKTWFADNYILGALSVGNIAFAIWYFFLHPYMFIRHVQPALLVGLGTLCYYLLDLVLTTKSTFTKYLLTSFMAAGFVGKVVKGIRLNGFIGR